MGRRGRWRRALLLVLALVLGLLVALLVVERARVRLRACEHRGRHADESSQDDGLTDDSLHIRRLLRRPRLHGTCQPVAAGLPWFSCVPKAERPTLPRWP